MTQKRRSIVFAWALTAILMGTPSVLAQSTSGRAAPKPASAPAAKPAEPRPADKLALEEQRIAEKYKHLEDVLLRMAELTTATDPRRAALLKKAIAQSKEQLIAVRFDRLVDLLGKDQLSKALENQTEVDQDLRALLELLMSENRAKRIESEKARIREYLKRINGIIKQVKDIQGRTLGGDNAKRLSEEQAKLADKTRELADDVRKTEDGKAKADGAKGEQSKPKGEEAKPKGEGGKEKGEEAKGKGKEGKEGGKGDSPQAKPQEGSQPDAKNEPSANPAPNRLEAAQQRMKDAEAKLKETQRRGAAEKQEEAIRELQMAKAKLEEILRQLREEEIGRTLAMLESRFRKMLDMQQDAFEGTVRLDRTPADQRTHNFEIDASRLSAKETQIVVELDKALVVLRDDGSAVAFLEASEQMRDDMQQVVDRLAQAKVGKMTQGIEEDIITALKEMIEALKKAQKDQEKKKPRAGQPPPGQPQDPPLVDGLAELKMIRALQMRVNSRTARYSTMIEGEQADSAELVDSLRQLAERQQRIHRVTRDLLTGRNQ
jgi:hypothetical protein